MLIKAFLAAALWLAGGPSQDTAPIAPSAVIGRATVVDGDTIEIRGQRIRLWGVDAPEARQTCERAAQTYRCGQEAANALSVWLGQRTVACSPEGQPDRYGRIVAICRVGRADVAAWLVRQGHALDYERYSRGRYQLAQAQARAQRMGVWAGPFERPWDWRAARR